MVVCTMATLERVSACNKETVLFVQLFSKSNTSSKYKVFSFFFFFKDDTQTAGKHTKICMASLVM